MGKHTEEYRLTVTDHVPGRTGVASDFTGWAEDPEAAIAAYREVLRRGQVDGTTVDLERVEATSLMSSGVAVKRETMSAHRAAGHFAEPVVSDAGRTVEITKGMAYALVAARESDGEVRTVTGTVCALIDRGLCEVGQTHPLTQDGRDVADMVKAEDALARSWSGSRGTRTYTV